MREFQISRSTALRDLAELERLGVPMYVKMEDTVDTKSFPLHYYRQFILQRQKF